ncbi:MAG: hypothetical protein E7L01_28545 [Paenibacillus macerans]|uniref:Uncharacterized protein n=2 Tax=Paenibacillus macerans TaxID=44252 RepID=A0A090ZF49_PAEMA|nr:hypothetical protein [Paenibacillus macerans]KFN09939.1 hypothetical protein DJ90_623 [Paenibacillus macerans]MBS5909693.1 hypothetical protein [Paenibacillus macerans]MCY7558984.1 hypothetical protein [Paenibacillus macerans]MDU5950101.1 hypothetical protein [Paenibacillus macerans]MDU7477262.1 hypothetical protein [Paenibacillus macerans]
MGEKNILAYFKSPEQAEGAARKLSALRVVDMSIDRFSRYPGEGYDPGNPVTGSISSLAAITQDAAITNRSAGILSAADPAASGLSHGGQGGPTGHDIVLTAVVDESVHHQALRIVEEAGGLI